MCMAWVPGQPTQAGDERCKVPTVQQDNALYPAAEGRRGPATATATAPANTVGATAEHTNSARSGRPALGRMVVPGNGGPGMKRNDRLTCFQRWISRYMVYQLQAQAAPLIRATPRTADGFACMD